MIYKALQLYLFLSKECPRLVSRETCHQQLEGIPRLTGEDTRTTRRKEGKQVDRHHSFSIGAKNPEKIVPRINMAPTAAGYNNRK